ncbi:universal stress protein [Halosolutus gelatinilyticus]|uniref:universal stress protein n=1 Tax=Halosolutus gelatinilyticus TaxID=2931975 RepID=UPI001FF3D8C2|nr:universal stress protein [Halosolutus gelatinilyticus]
MSSHLLQRIVVPIANESDAKTTCRALSAHLGDSDVLIHVVNVIEKGGGAPDKAPLAAMEEQADEIFEFVENYFGTTAYDVETERRYGTDVVEEIVAAAAEADATAIAFVPRPGGRLSSLLSGNLSSQLTRAGQVPVIVLPAEVDAE